MALSKEEILAIDDIKVEKIFIKEWHDYIYIKTMTGFDRDSFEVEMLNQRNSGKSKNIRSALAARTICDEEGKLLFSLQEIEVLGNKSCAALDRIFDVAQKLNKLSEEDVEELAGKSEASQS